MLAWIDPGLTLMREEFGPYRLEAKLGEGGLAEVYRACGADGQVIALKRLSRVHLDTHVLADVFRREARISTLLQSRHLLGALDSGEVDGWPFLTMRIAEGGSLQALMTETGVDGVRELAKGLGTALTVVHEFGYLHGDLSPGNVMFDDEDKVLLGDFGAAVALGDKQDKPRGTYPYMSPEQVRGEPLDERSDVFSLATLLWQCTSGQRIFSREAQHLCFVAVVEAEPPSMPKRFSAVEMVLRRALGKEASSRMESPEELCDAFVGAL